MVLMHARGFFVEEAAAGAVVEDVRFAEDGEQLSSLWCDASRPVGDVGEGVGVLNMCMAAWDDMEGESGDESELVVVAGEGGNWKSKSSRVGKARSGWKPLRRDAAWWKCSANGLDGDNALTAVDDDDDEDDGEDDGETVY